MTSGLGNQRSIQLSYAGWCVYANVVGGRQQGNLRLVIPSFDCLQLRPLRVIVKEC